MAYKGTGAPAFGQDQVTYTMPHPIRGGRTEMYEVIQEVYENILHELLPQKRLLRFVGEYEFYNVPSATLTQLQLAYTRHRTIGWAPHSDYSKISFKVHVEELQILPVNGMIDIDKVLMTVKGVEPVTFIPNLDTMIRGHFKPLVLMVTPSP